VRACPYCAEEIQDAAIVCRFCGRDVKPVAATKPERPVGVGLPAQRWYSLDERVKARSPEPERPKRASIWAKLGGALEIFEPTALRPNRSRTRQSMVRDYTSVRAYRADVDRLVQAGWVIQHQSEGPPDGREHIIVNWIREPKPKRGG
jgi:hypothetical protein